MPVDLMSLAEGHGEVKNRSLSDLRGSTLSKSLLSKFEAVSPEPQSPPKRVSMTGKVWTPPQASDKQTPSQEPHKSPNSVTALPDFSALREEPPEQPLSPRLSDNPFLQKDKVKRASLTPPWEKTSAPIMAPATLPVAFLEPIAPRQPDLAEMLGNTTAHAGSLEEPAADPAAGPVASDKSSDKGLEKPRFSPAKQLPVTTRVDDDEPTSHRTPSPEAVRPPSPKAKPRSSDGFFGAPQSPRSLPGQHLPGQHSTEWLLNVNGMPANSALVDVTDSSASAPHEASEAAAKAGTRKSRGRGRFSFLNVLPSRRSVAK